MGDRPVIVKIGGAAITDKGVRRHDLPKRLSAAAAALARAYRGGRLVVVHGAGSFGHFEARDHRLNSTDPVDFPAKSPLGIARCRASLAQLHARVLDALVAAGIPAVSTSVFPTAALFDQGFAGVLSAGLVPVLHGDVVLLRQDVDDGDAGRPRSSNPCRVLSGDEIVARLAVQYGPEAWAGRQPPERAVFITGVSGVFTADPVTCQGARLIHRIEVGCEGTGAGDLVWDIAGYTCRLVLWPEEGGGASTLTASGLPGAPLQPAAAGSLTASTLADVTGGIHGKLSAAVRLVRDWHCSKSPGRAAGGLGRRFVVSVSGPEEAEALSVICDAEAGTEAVLATRATHILWAGAGRAT